MANTITQIKYKKSSCHFCNEWLDNDNFKAHIQVCGQRLERCPNNCLSYIQRKRMGDHMRECNVTSPDFIQYKAAQTIDTSEKPPDEAVTHFYPDDADVESKLLDIEQNIIALRNALNEEIKQRHRLITDVGEVRKQNLTAERGINQLSILIEELKKCFGEETTTRETEIKGCQNEIERIERGYQDAKEWKRELRLLLDFIENELQFREGIQQNLDMLIADQKLMASKIELVEREIERFRHRKSLESPPKGDAEMNENEIPRIRRPASTIEQNLLINELRARVPAYSPENILATKLANITLEVKQMQNVVNETEEKCERLEKIVLETRKCAAETRQELQDLEIHLKNQRKFAGIHNIKGHLIWRIDNFAAKLKEAKENEVILKSPVFCNKQYGYTLRLDVCLNGIGTWKGRNILACLNVVSGEWDALLPWPCKLEADIILRDQPNELKESKSISKTIMVKKRTASYEQNQYIFISHKTLATNNYVKKDAIFFEVRVLRSQH